MSKRKVQVISFDCKSKPLPPAMRVIFTESFHKPFIPHVSLKVYTNQLYISHVSLKVYTNQLVISHISLNIYTNQLFPMFH